jgi:hypothetical protein
MFFFCDEQIDFPDTDDEIDQLRRVVAFRKRLDSIGYTVSYSERGLFRETLRPRLLRAIADILAGKARPEIAYEVPAVSPESEAQVRDLAKAYDETRRDMPSGSKRTIEMSKIFNAMVELASGVRPLLGNLQTSASAGERLAAVAILNAFPDADHLGWLAERLDNPNTESPFIGYQSAMALAQAARSLPADNRAELDAALDRALELARRLPGDPDRIKALEHTKQELARR